MLATLHTSCIQELRAAQAKRQLLSVTHAHLLPTSPSAQSSELHRLQVSYYPLHTCTCSRLAPLLRAQSCRGYRSVTIRYARAPAPD